MANDTLILDTIHDHAAAQAGKVFLTQPLGGGKVADVKELVAKLRNEAKVVS